MPAGNLDFLPTKRVYHMRYISGKEIVNFESVGEVAYVKVALPAGPVSELYLQ